MGSLFPGMDPHLERYWLDVHQSLVTYARDALNRELPPDLLARAEERVLIDASGEMECEPRTEGYVVILDRAAGERLITVVEFPSASNKLAGDDRDAYRPKRRELIDGGVNVVEVDLVRQGSWRELLSPHILPRELETTYRATIRKAQQPGKVWVYRIQLRDRLQAIRIPLRRMRMSCWIFNNWSSRRTATADTSGPTTANPAIRPLKVTTRSGPRRYCAQPESAADPTVAAGLEPARHRCTGLTIRPATSYGLRHKLAGLESNQRISRSKRDVCTVTDCPRISEPPRHDLRVGFPGQSRACCCYTTGRAERFQARADSPMRESNPRCNHGEVA